MGIINKSKDSTNTQSLVTASIPSTTAPIKRRASSARKSDLGAFLEGEEDQGLGKTRDKGPISLPSPGSDGVAGSLASPSEPPLLESIESSSLEPSVSKALDSLCTEYRRLGIKIKDMKDTQDSLKGEIQELAFSIPAKKITGPGWNTTRSAKTSTCLNKEKLIDLCTDKGIDPVEVLDIISLSTEKKKGEEYVTVTEG